MATEEPAFNEDDLYDQFPAGRVRRVRARRGFQYVGPHQRRVAVHGRGPGEPCHPRVRRCAVRGHVRAVQEQPPRVGILHPQAARCDDRRRRRHRGRRGGHLAPTDPRTPIATLVLHHERTLAHRITRSIVVSDGDAGGTDHPQGADPRGSVPRSRRMPCPSCGAQNAEAARFCGSCGGRLTATCPHCGADVPVGLRFCNACGRADAGARRADRRPLGTSEPEPGLPSERRLVSVLFVDLEDFTALAESLDPEDVRNLQARYFEAARSVVAHYGGTLEKFIGDAVMAVWGAPAAHEDDGERAVRAASSSWRRSPGCAERPPADACSARAAVGTGEVAVTPGVDGQGMVAGDLVNTAARLQAAAPSGWRARRRHDATRGGRRAHLRAGRARDAQGQEPAGHARGSPSGSPTSARRVGRPVTPVPSSAAGRARRAGRPLSSARSRPAAAGSSRCSASPASARAAWLWEFERHLDALPETARAPRRPGAIVRRRASRSRPSRRWSAGAPASARERRPRSPGGSWTRTLDELVPDEVERHWIEPRLGHPARPGLALPQFERDELFAAWRRFFERVSEWAPVGPHLRGSPVGRPGAARLHRPPGDVVSRRIRS